MSKFILLFLCALFAEEWTTYRCVVSSSIETNGSTSTSLSTIAAKRINGEVWLRITQIEPEKRRFISISKDGKTVTFFPEEGRIEEGTSNTDNQALNIETLIAPLLPKELSSRSSVTISLPEIFAVNYGADSLKVTRHSNTDGEIDSLTFFKGVIPILAVVSAKKWLHDKRWLMPSSIDITNYSPKIVTKTRYEGYRINSEIPDGTFDMSRIRNE